MDGSATALPDHANIVIIGAGIVGCSVAYQLAQRGVRDIIIVEQDIWPEPGGSTQHASNFSFPHDHTKVMAKFSNYGLEFFAGLEHDGKPCFVTSGGIEVAQTNDRMRELQRKVASGKSWGIESEMISPSEANRLSPFLNVRRIKGAMWTASAGLVTRAVDAAAEMVLQAEQMGALTMAPRTTVTGVDVNGGRVEGLHTSRGYIGADLIVCCAGVWAR